MQARAAIAVLLLLALVAGCSETRRPLGEDCLKDEDCLSGTCSQLRCAAAPSLLDGSLLAPPTDAMAPAADAADAADGADMDAKVDGAAPLDAPSDG